MSSHHIPGGNPTAPQNRDQVGEADRRPWRQKTFRLPENIATVLEQALEAGRIFDGATSEVEALEAMCIEFLHDRSISRLLMEENPLNVLRHRSLEKKIDVGFRCIVCETSQDLHVHHIWPRSYHGEGQFEDIHNPANLAVLCAKCHETVHAQGWRNWVSVLTEKDAAARRQVSQYGFRYTQRHSGGVAKKWT